MNYPLQNKMAIDTTVVFESKEQRSNASEDLVKSQTLTVKFDFTNVTEEEILQFLVSSTSCMKMFQNNVTKKWTNKQTQEFVRQGVYNVSVREMLDGRIRAALTPEKSASRGLEQMMKKGLTVIQIQKILEGLQK